jgi:hypothetical protein
MFTPALYQDHQKFLLLTSIGVAEAHLISSSIAGHFKSDLREFGGEPGSRLIERFVNWRDDPDSILEFTRQYGPLKVKAIPGGTFSFKIEDFRKAQAMFRELWTHPETFAEMKATDGKLRLVGGTVTFSAVDLFRYLQFDLLMSDAGRVRVCKRAECAHPYFVAAHLKKRFCSPECAEEGQRDLKRVWWQKNGQQWRDKQREEGEQNGSNKKG